MPELGQGPTKAQPSATTIFDSSLLSLAVLAWPVGDHQHLLASLANL
jgi:hypothetical protein